MRCDNGYVLLPPSVHPSGHVYSWTGATQSIALPSRALARLRDACTRSIVSAPSPSFSLVDVAGPHRATATCSGVSTPYIARLPPGLTNGDGRNNACYQLAAWLTHDMAQTEADTLSWCERYNSGLAEPLSNRELRTSLRTPRSTGSELWPWTHPRAYCFRTCTTFSDCAAIGSGTLRDKRGKCRRACAARARSALSDVA